MFYKFTSLFLALVLALSVITPSIFAADPETETNVPVVEVEQPAQSVEETGQVEEVQAEANPVVEIPGVSFEEGAPGAIAYKHVEKLALEIGSRLTGSVGEQAARAYIKEQFEKLEFKTELQDFSFTNRGNFFQSQNVIATKKGQSPQVIIVGAHYDSVTAGKGADDNASGVAVMLETAAKVADIQTPYTIKFIAFSGEEQSKKGSEFFKSQMTAEEIRNTVAMINLDSVIAGDNMYIYGGKQDGGWVRETGLAIAQRLDLKLQTNPGDNPQYPKGTTGNWSDHAPFQAAGIPIAYLEATNWALGEKDGYTQTEKDGSIWHTAKDDLNFIAQNYPGRIEERLSTFSQVLTGLVTEIQGLRVSNDKVSMTEKRVIDVEFELNGQDVDVSKLQFTFGDKPLNAWKQWKGSSKQYDGDPFITLVEAPTVTGTTLKAKIAFDLMYTLSTPKKDEQGNTIYVDIPTNDLSSRTVRTLYPSQIGTFQLALKDGESTLATTQMKLNVYDGYHTFDEIKPAIDRITKEANELNDRYINTSVLGKSVQGRDIQFTVLAKDKATVDKYLNETLPAMKQDPAALQEAIKSGNTEFKVPIWINNIHPDEAPGVDAILDLFKALSQDKIVTFKTTDKDGQETSIDFNVDEALNHVFFLINYTQNPDGRYLNTRENANKFDLNRDNSYQTQVETQIVTAEIAKWSPISFLDFHGFVGGFLIEPCTPPHDPNIEYDLVIDNMIELATAFGEAGIANTSYTSYHIPYEENRKKAEDPNYVPKPGSQVTGWDDASPAYTAVYAMHQGSLGHTIEIPSLNEESSKALFYGGVAAIDYIANNTQKLFVNQLEIFKRGLNNKDVGEAVDKYLINAKHEQIGRPRGDNANFFPEYYVLPLDKKLQKNQLEVYRMVQYLLRNDVKVEQSAQAVKVGEVEYPAGSYIVNMHQVKRGFANLVLYDGINVSDYDALYADIIQNFPDMRGFNSYVVRQADAFKGKTNPVAKVEIPATSVSANVDNYVLRNTNNDVIKAVNELLANNKRVLMLTSGGSNYETGDFLVSKESLQSVSSKYFLEVVPFNGNASTSGKLLKSAKVAAAGIFPTYVLKELGFNLVDDQANGDVLVNSFNKDLISTGKPYIGFGRAELDSLDKSKLLDGFTFKTTFRSHEGLFKSVLSQNNVITAPYDSNEYLYTASGSYITSVPNDAKVIATVSNDADYFKAGWWPGNEAIKGQIVAFTYNVGKLNLTYFSNEPLHRAHGQKQFRLLANAIYNATATDYEAPYYPSNPGGPVNPGTPVDPGKPVDPETPVTPEKPETPETPAFTDLGPVASWAQEAIEALTKKGILQGVAEGKFAPAKDVTRAEFITMLVRAFDLLDVKAKVDFTDVQSNAWYYEYVATAVEKGLIQGVGGNKFDPNRAITREEMAIMSANVLKAVKNKTAADAAAALAKFKDQDSMASYAKDAIALLTENNVINGMTATTFQPKGIANRAQAAVIINRMLGIE